MSVSGLLIENLCKLPWFNSVTTRATLISDYIRGRSYVLALFTAEKTKVNAALERTKDSATRMTMNGSKPFGIKAVWEGR